MLKVDVAVSREASDALSEVLLRLSPSGVQVEDKNDLVVLTVYVPDTFPVEDIQNRVNTIINSLASEGLNVELDRITVSMVAEKDWVEAYKKQFRPIRIGKLLIKPSWEEVEADPDEIVIELDPGLAFGTGMHPTTEGCLLFLQEYVSGGEVVLDYGTGSGILAIAAVKLGAQKAIAIDNDELAVVTASENAARNDVSDRIDFRTAGLSQIEPVQIDILVANLTAPLIIESLPVIVRKLEKAKLFIASGITIEQKDMVITALQENGFGIEKVHVKGDWITLVSRFV